jgi:hypothetical protein
VTGKGYVRNYLFRATAQAVAAACSVIDAVPLLFILLALCMMHTMNSCDTVPVTDAVLLLLLSSYNAAAAAAACTAARV